jgi:FtsH-binding integral membrane protein
MFRRMHRVFRHGSAFRSASTPRPWTVVRGLGAGTAVAVGVVASSTAQSGRGAKSNSDFPPINEQTPTKTTGFADLKADVGLRKFMREVYLWTGGGLAATIGAASVMARMITTPPVTIAVFGAGAVGSFASLWGLTADPQRKLGFGALCLSMAAVVHPLVAIAQQTKPGLVMTAGITTVLTMIGATAATFSDPKKRITSWGPTMYGGVTCLVGLNLAALAALVLTRGRATPRFYEMLRTYYSVESVMGIALFSGLTAFTSEQAIEDYKSGHANALLTATSLYLNGVNIFIRILDLLIKSNSED